MSDFGFLRLSEGVNHWVWIDTVHTSLPPLKVASCVNNHWTLEYVVKRTTKRGTRAHTNKQYSVLIHTQILFVYEYSTLQSILGKILSRFRPLHIFCNHASWCRMDEASICFMYEIKSKKKRHRKKVGKVGIVMST